MDVAKIMIVGWVQPSDAELRYTNAAMPVGTFKVVVNTRRRKDGEWDDIANWYNVIIFGAMAEKLAPNILKGSRVVVSGRLVLEPWRSRDGREGQSLSLNASEVIIVSAVEPEREAQTTSNWRERPTDAGSMEDLPF